MNKNRKGFTLIEIIAVLVILGILAAVAVPRYLDLQTDAKSKAAQGQVAEIKGTLSTAWGKAMLATNGTASMDNVLANATITDGAVFTTGTGTDEWNQTVTATGSTAAIVVLNKAGDAGYTNTGSWSMP